jgi:cell division protein FtsL
MKINQQPPKKSFKLHLILLVIVIILTVLQIVCANRLITAGKNLQSLEQQAELLESENGKLTSEVAAAASLERLKKESTTLGFVDNPQYFNLSGDKPIALGQ